MLTFYVKYGKLSAGTRYEAVGNQFDFLKGDIFGNELSRVDDVISLDSDSHAVFVLLVGFEFAYDLGVVESFAAVDGDIFVPFDVEVVIAFGTL